MKYNDEAFNISAQFYARLNKDGESQITKNWQNKLLHILLQRCLVELQKHKEENTGIIKFKFYNRYLGSVDEGYELIENLMDSKQFDAFASQYCFYLGDIEYRCDENDDAFYEIIWDYKTYYETLSTRKDVEVSHASYQLLRRLNEFK